MLIIKFYRDFLYMGTIVCFATRIYRNKNIKYKWSWKEACQIIVIK